MQKGKHPTSKIVKGLGAMTMNMTKYLWAGRRSCGCYCFKASRGVYTLKFTKAFPWSNLHSVADHPNSVFDKLMVPLETHRILLNCDVCFCCLYLVIICVTLSICCICDVCPFKFYIYPF